MDGNLIWISWYYTCIGQLFLYVVCVQCLKYTKNTYNINTKFNETPTITEIIKNIEDYSLMKSNQEPHFQYLSKITQNFFNFLQILISRSFCKLNPKSCY